MRGGLFRLLMMFGPMLFRQYQNYKNRKDRERMRNALPRNHRDDGYQRRDSRQDGYRDDQYQRRDNRQDGYGNDGYQRRSNRQEEMPRQRDNAQYERRSQTPPPPPPPKQKEISQEEKDFNLKEDEFMIDKEVLQDYVGKEATVMGDDVNQAPIADKAPEKPIEGIVENVKEIIGNTEKEVPLTDEDDLDLKNIFFKKDA